MQKYTTMNVGLEVVRLNMDKRRRLGNNIADEVAVGFGWPLQVVQDD